MIAISTVCGEFFKSFFSDGAGQDFSRETRNELEESAQIDVLSTDVLSAGEPIASSSNCSLALHRSVGVINRILLLSFLLLVASCSDNDNDNASEPAAGTGTADGETALFRIMPLGDSITQADGSHDSYRRPLWLGLQAAGFEVDFVGSRRRHRMGSAPNDDFDQDHEGHWGWRADEILEEIEDWAGAHNPDAVLVHLGSNDIFQGQSVQSTVDELADIVSRLRRVNERVVVLLAQIIPSSSERLNREIRQLNDAMARLAERLDTPQSPVRVVDQYSGFDATESTYDGIHPNARGETQMAVRWQEALIEHLGQQTTEASASDVPAQ